MIMPTFAYGTLEKLKAAIDSGRVGYPTYAWLCDTLQYAFVNKNKEIELMGVPKLTGTTDNPLVLSNLDAGIYCIIGSYQIFADSETIYTTPDYTDSYIFAIIAKNDGVTKIRRITADTIDDYTDDGSGGTHTTSYVTTDYLAEKGYTTVAQVNSIVETQVTEQIAALKVTLETEMKEYVDEVVGEQVAELVPEEVEKIVETATPEDIRDLFSV